MTTPHQAVETAIACFEEIIAQDDQHAYTARVGLDALRAELARPLEVAAPVIKYVPVSDKLRTEHWGHPNDDEPRGPELKEALRLRGDDEGQGLDGYWKWGFCAGFNAAASRVPVASVVVSDPIGWISRRGLQALRAGASPTVHAKAGGKYDVPISVLPKTPTPVPGGAGADSARMQPVQPASVDIERPYCPKLIGPCPDGCASVKVKCSDRAHGDCWRVKA